MMLSSRLLSRITIGVLCILILLLVRMAIHHFADVEEKALELSLRKRDYFAICLLVRDEENIVEWLDYHLAMGTSTFYVHDHNNDTSILQNTLRPYIEKKQVVYHAMSPAKKYKVGNRNITAQIVVYNRCLQLHRKKHQFIGFIDSDEFIVVANSSHRSIPSVLKNFEAYGGVTMNWKVFGSSGHIQKPPGGVIANYHMCYSDLHVKTIVNTQYVVKDQGQPHSFSYKQRYFAVDTSGQRLDGPRNPPDLNSRYYPDRKAQYANYNYSGQFVPILATEIPSYLYSTMYVNHYHTKSAEEYQQKSKRGRFDINSPLTMEYFDGVNSRATENCSILAMPRKLTSSPIIR